MDLYDSFTFSITNVELDYCLENAFDIIFNPTNQILPPKSGTKIKTEKNFIEKVMENGDEDTPFIQFVISQKKKQENIDNKIKIIYSIFPEIGIIIQEFDVRINTILINCLIDLIGQYLKIFLSEEENNNEINKKEIKKEEELLIEDESKTINQKIDKLLNKGEDIKYIPEILITLLNTLCATLTSFSDITIKLSELTFINVFSDFDSLFTKLYTFYKNKLLAQIYKVVLNLDIIGNPVNLVEGLGTGIFEFFNEPRKGLLKGPEEFGLGIARGTKSLVSNIVGGGFGSVSKITGTLLNASKNLSSLGTEEEIVIKEEEKPRGLLKGTLSGLKKGFGELAHGVTGIVTKPIEQTKKSGVGGFFKGLGSGLLGAVLSPVNTVLTVGTEVTSGISNSEFISNKKSLRRFRLPRTLYKYKPLTPYNEEEEINLKQKIKEDEKNNRNILSLTNESLYLENSTEFIMSSCMKGGNIMLFTNVMIKIMNKECNKFLKKIYICNIDFVIENNQEIKLVMKNNKQELIGFLKNNDKEDFVKKINKYLE